MPCFLIKIYDLITKYYLKYTNLYTRKKVKKLCMYLLTYAKRKKWRMNKPETNELSYLTVQFSCSVMSDSLQPHGLWHARLPCPSPTPRAYSNSCPLSWWCHPSISSSVFPFSFYLQSLPASGSFPMSQFFALGGQSIRVSASASVLPMNIQEYCWAYTPRKPELKETRVPQCSSQHCWQKPGHGSNLDVHRQTNG